MRLKVEIYLKGLKSQINRVAYVNGGIRLEDFCKYVIISMKGSCKHLFQLILNEESGYLGSGCNVSDWYDEQMMNDLTLEDLGLYEEDELMVNYDFRNDWEIIVKIIEIDEVSPTKDFEIISGRGYGLLEDCGGIKVLRKIVTNKLDSLDKFYLLEECKEYKDYDINNFNILTINSEIDDYINKYLELVKPKSYIMNVTLNEFDKEIKRKISVDSNVRLDIFCECVIKIMNGDLNHPYTIKINKEYLDEEELKKYDLNHLKLCEKQKFKIIYDFGDNWVFNVAISKVINDYGDKRMYVISGKGYGIIDDCGGIYGLYEIFNKINNDWGEYDINNFDLDKANSFIDYYI